MCTRFTRTSPPNRRANWPPLQCRSVAGRSRRGTQTRRHATGTGVVEVGACAGVVERRQPEDQTDQCPGRDAAGSPNVPRVLSAQAVTDPRGWLFRVGQGWPEEAAVPHPVERWRLVRVRGIVGCLDRRQGEVGNLLRHHPAGERPRAADSRSDAAILPLATAIVGEGS